MTTALAKFAHLAPGGGGVVLADPDAARRHMARRFTNHRLEVQGGGAFAFQHQEAGLDRVALHHVAYGAEVVIGNEGRSRFYLLQLTLDGECRIAAEDWRVRLAPGTLFLMNPGTVYRKEWSSAGRQLMVQIPADGFGDGRAVRFLPRELAADGEGRGIFRFLDFLCDDLRDTAGASRDPLLRAAHERTLLLALLRTFPHRQLVPESALPAPFHVRRAEAIIHDRLAEPLRIDALAREAGVAERTLREGFQRFRGMAPQAFIQEARLARVREELCGGRSGRSLTEIALDAGFTHMGRFAAAYARRYGEKPSETRRGGGQG